jgi:tetratricopeptide (TPR) repeat protein
VREASFQVGRLLEGLAFDRARTLIVVAGDHGEAFGEHGEISHSVFAYDTTLRVPLIVAGPGFAPGTVADAPVSLVDVAPTIASGAGLGTFDSDGRDLRRAADAPERPIYSETFAPLLDFGWSPLRAVRSGSWKYIAAPKPELYDLSADPGETHNLMATEAVAARAADLARQVDAISPATLGSAATTDDDRESRARLQALGYASGRGASAGDRADPKDRKALAGEIARVTSGELTGAGLERALRDIIAADPQNPQANVRLGYLLQESRRCAEAVRRFTTAIDGHLASADAHLGRAACELASGQTAGALATLTAAQVIEPDNPVVIANLGLVTSDAGRPAAAIPHLQRALSLDPNLHQARFGLAVALARTGRRADAAREAQELLRRLPADAPQRAEVERLLAATR